ncbi:uncharacterized protein MONOS_16902 [Monocercomonoides exilis]|uniref:uncharacterized protein n=1 Tax=Monocercomonoides exilis TaxID=2049356 RepID=UPI00355AB17A|nr:hypothetical protein MONOS_16902 [Monocercomonoides exilis]
MIEKKILSVENAILLLKHIGHFKSLKGISIYNIDTSSLSQKFKEMIIDENEKKKDEKNEKLMIDLCESYLLLNEGIFSESLSICVPCLLKVALNKEEREEVQKEVEMALLALWNTRFIKIEQELYLSEIKEIIQHHQEHHNMTHLAYQSAWDFLINKFYDDKFYKKIVLNKQHQARDESLEEVIVIELHFVKEAKREMEELSKCVDWKRKDDKKVKEKKEMIILMKWLDTINGFFHSCRSWNEDFAGLIRRTVQILRASRCNYGEIHVKCLYMIRRAAEEKIVKIGDLLKGESVDVILEEIQQPTTYNNAMRNCLYFFLEISERLKEKTDNKANEAKRMELKRKIFEKMEEKGYEDTLASLYGEFSLINEGYRNCLPLNISEYFVNI